MDEPLAQHAVVSGATVAEGALIEPAVIWTSAPASTRRTSRAGSRWKPGRALGVGEQDASRAVRGRPPPARFAARPATAGTRAAATGRRRARTRAGRRRRGRSAARSTSRRPARPRAGCRARERLDQLGHALASRAGPRREAPVDVRCRGDHPRAAATAAPPAPRSRRASAARRRGRGGCGRGGRSRERYDRASHVPLDRGRHRWLRHRQPGGAQATELAPAPRRHDRARVRLRAGRRPAAARRVARGAGRPPVDGQPARGRRGDARGGRRGGRGARAWRSRPSPARATRPTRSSTSPRSSGADLIVVGNKGMTGAKRFLLGSVPNKVSHHAPCWVLIIRTT